MNIFVTLDRNYLRPLRVMLGSLFLNNPGESFDIYLAADGIYANDLRGLSSLCLHGSVHYHFLDTSEDWFSDAPTGRYYSRAMYYRLLAAEILPKSLNRVLYLDPDILIIGRIRPLYDPNIDDSLYAAAMHKGLISISTPLSKMRLPDYSADNYFNSGVLLMNLTKMRNDIKPEQIFDYVRKNHQALILPDQDVLNGLYASRIKPIDESVWNYDARKYDTYKLASQGEADLNWVMENTSILHFCGKRKPWNPSYKGRFAILYKHYQFMIDRICQTK